jgi:hypothetical protein
VFCLCILNGAKQEMSHTTDGKTRDKWFQNLIKTVYSSLRMIGAIQYSEDTIKLQLKHLKMICLVLMTKPYRKQKMKC